MTVFWAGFIRYFKGVWLVLWLLMACAVNAQQALTKADKAMLKRLDASARQADWDSLGLKYGPDNPHPDTDRAKAEAKALVDQWTEKHGDGLGEPPNKRPAGQVLIFASFSLQDKGLDDLMFHASATQDAVVVFRGVPDERNVQQSILSIQAIASRHTPVTPTIIDPVLFRKFNITQVPTIVYLDDTREKELARVQGLITAQWLQARVAQNKRGDQGVRGAVEKILERDLIEVMQERVMAIDWEKKKAEGIARFWDNQQFVILPRAPRPRLRHIDPSVYVAEDIVDSEGNIITPKGTTINPLDLRAFDQAIVVFDPLDKKQLALVDQRLPALERQHSRTMLLVTQIDRAEGWQSYQAITDRFDAHVFKLMGDLQSRFELEYVPAVITANKTHFIVEELAAADEEAAPPSRLNRRRHNPQRLNPQILNLQPPNPRWRPVMQRILKHLILTLMLLPFGTLAADGCVNANVLSHKLISNICWDCMFPLRIGGVPVNVGSGTAPPDAVNSPLCLCYDDLGLPRPGVTTSMWQPARLIEFQRVPGCSSVMNGISLPGFDRLFQGTLAGNEALEAHSKYFTHYHYYAFPLFSMLELFDTGGCVTDGYLDFDAMFFSELDPTWNNAFLAFFLNPEAAAVVNLAATLACIPDAVSATAGYPIDQLFWCAGTWGKIYPLSGHQNTDYGPLVGSSLGTVKVLAALHRRGLARRTMGKDAMCNAVYAPIIPKSMYRYTMLHPVPETERAHVTGESVMRWGLGRIIPSRGEDLIYTIWRWNDCCNTF